jgi:hypothetical protein
MEHFVISRFLTACRALRLLLKRVIKSILFSHSLRWQRTFYPLTRSPPDGSVQQHLSTFC